MRPLIGDDGYCSSLRAAYRRGVITQNEQLEQLRIFRLITQTLEPRLDGDSLVAALVATFDATIVEFTPGCRYPAPRRDVRCARRKGRAVRVVVESSVCQGCERREEAQG